MAVVYGTGRFTGLDPLGEAMGEALAGFFQRKQEQKDWQRFVDWYGQQFGQGQQQPQQSQGNAPGPAQAPPGIQNMSPILPNPGLGMIPNPQYGGLQQGMGGGQAMGMAQGPPFSNLAPPNVEGGAALGGQSPFGGLNLQGLEAIRDPRIKEALIPYLLQRMDGGQDIGSMPFEFTQLPRSEWPKASRIRAGIEPRAGSVQPGAGGRELNEIGKWQRIITGATQEIEDRNTGTKTTQTKAGQEKLVAMAQQQIERLGNKMLSDSARELGVSLNQLQAEERGPRDVMENAKAVSELATMFPGLPEIDKARVRAAIRGGHTAAEILVSIKSYAEQK
jgi:hypothetical protein